MAERLPTLEWNVAYMSCNDKKIKTFNLFDMGYFFDDCARSYRKIGEDREAFLESVKRILGYYFWSKCEWEMVLSAWPPNERFKESKVDVYDQVMLNWDRFSDYVWENRRAFRKRKVKK